MRLQLSRIRKIEMKKKWRINWGRVAQPADFRKPSAIFSVGHKTTEERAL